MSHHCLSVSLKDLLQDIHGVESPVFGLLLFFTSLAVVLAVWRCRRPKRHTRALFFIFFGIFISGVGAVIMLQSSFIRSEAFYMNLYFFLYSGLLFASLSAAFILVYPAVEVDSPSLSIINMISEAGAAGLEKTVLYESLNDDFLVFPRIDDTIRDRLVSRNEKGKYILTPKGVSFVNIFIFFRRLLNITEKGG